MMGRTTPEWTGKTADTAAPPRVRLRVFDAHKGICHITKRKITPADKWELDHVLALCNGGENRESNLAPAISAAHKAKTAQDVAQKSKDSRVRQKHLGGRKPSSEIPGSKSSRWKRKIDGTVVLR